VKTLFVKTLLTFAIVALLLCLTSLSRGQPTLTIKTTNTAAVVGSTVYFYADSSSNGFCGGNFNYMFQHAGTNVLNIISLVAGNGTGGYTGDGILATNAELNDPNGIAIDGIGDIFIADGSNNRIREVYTNGYIYTIAGGGTNYGTDGLGDGGAATDASFNHPVSVAGDKFGNLYICDQGNNLVRKVDTNGIITVFAGAATNSGTDGIGDGGPAFGAYLNDPTSVTVDTNGNVYISDNWDSVVREVNATSGVISIVAGSYGNSGYGGDGGPATNALLSQPNGLCVDQWGNLYIADSGNNLIRMVGTNGYISTVAGGGDFPGNDDVGDGELATNASLNFPNDVGVDPFGNLFIADFNNERIREVDSVGIITTVVGTGEQGYSSDVATNSDISSPTGVDVGIDNLGNLYVADAGNNVVQIVNNMLMQDGILALTGVTTDDAGSYQAILNSACGSVTSSPAILMVGLPPVITLEPSNQIVLPGANVTNTVMVTGSSTFYYQWYSNSIAMGGATNSTLWFHSVQTNSDAGYFSRDQHLWSRYQFSCDTECGHFSIHHHATR
jgi:sugar lactone lactonase YvrE